MEWYWILILVLGGVLAGFVGAGLAIYYCMRDFNPMGSTGWR